MDLIDEIFLNKSAPKSLIYQKSAPELMNSV